VAVHRRRSAFPDLDLVHRGRERPVLAPDQRADLRVHRADLVEPLDAYPVDLRLVQGSRVDDHPR
jgi:hypothetical protein